MSKLFILMFGFLAGSLFFSGTPDHCKQEQNSGFAFVQDFQDQGLLGDFELIDTEENENDKDEPSFITNNFCYRYKKSQVILIEGTPIFLVYEHSPPDQFTNLPPPFLPLNLYS